MPLSAIRIIAYLAFAIYLSLSFVADFNESRIGFTEDAGLTVAVVKTITQGEQVLLGPPSHTGGRHLGAIGYWHMLLPYLAASGNLTATFFIIALAELAAMIWMCHLAAQIAAPVLRPIVLSAGFLCIAASRYFNLLFYPWQNNFLIVTSAFFLYAMWRLYKSRPFSKGLLFLSASLLVQFHYSAIPLVAIGGAYALILLYLRGKLFAFDRRDWVLILFAILTWVPLAVYEARFPGTIHESILHHGSDPKPDAGFRASAQLNFNFFKDFILGGDFVPSALESARQYLLYSTAILLIFFLVRFVLYSATEKLFILFIALAVTLYWLVLSRLSAPLYPNYIYALLPLPIVFGAWAIAQAFGDLFRSNYLIIKICAAALVVIWCSLSIRQAIRRIGVPYFNPPYQSLQHAREVSQLVLSDAGDKPFDLQLHAASRDMHGAYTYYFGRQYYSGILYWNWLKELPQEKPPEPKVRYLISCPHLNGRAWKRAVKASRSHGWKKERELTLSECKTCGVCRILRFSPK